MNYKITKQATFFKKNYTQTEINSILEKKILSKNLYYKFFIREYIQTLNKKKIIQVDNSYSNWNILKGTLFIESLYIKKKTVLGYSMNIKVYHYKNKRNSNYSFNSFFFNYINSKLPNYVNKLNNYFTTLLKNKKVKNYKNFPLSLLILFPTKGGFFVYSLGAVGFLSKNDFVYSFFKNTLTGKKKKKIVYIKRILKTYCSFLYLKSLIKVNLIWGFYIKMNNRLLIKLRYVIKKRENKKKLKFFSNRNKKIFLVFVSKKKLKKNKNI